MLFHQMAAAQEASIKAAAEKAAAHATDISNVLRWENYVTPKEKVEELHSKRDVQELRSNSLSPSARCLRLKGKSASPARYRKGCKEPENDTLRGCTSYKHPRGLNYHDDDDRDYHRLNYRRDDYTSSGRNRSRRHRSRSRRRRRSRSRSRNRNSSMERSSDFGSHVRRYRNKRRSSSPSKEDLNQHGGVSGREKTGAGKQKQEDYRPKNKLYTGEDSRFSSRSTHSSAKLSESRTEEDSLKISTPNTSTPVVSDEGALNIVPSGMYSDSDSSASVLLKFTGQKALLIPIDSQPDKEDKLACPSPTDHGSLDKFKFLARSKQRSWSNRGEKLQSKTEVQIERTDTVSLQTLVSRGSLLFSS